MGTAYLVYPGATHTRFAHSLGTMNVMDKVAHKLDILGHISSEEEIQILRMAALLHDIGHFPFSHALENPISVISSKIRKPDQIIQPWQFGHGETKATCLWLEGLPLLKPTDIVEGREARIHRMPPGPERARLRSITFQGIAQTKFTLQYRP